MASKTQATWNDYRAWVFERWLGLLGPALITLYIITCGPYLSTSALPAAAAFSASGAAPGYAEINELASLDQLRTSFQNDVGKVRIVALLSPT